MSGQAVSWRQELSRRGAQARWLGTLLQMLEPALLGVCSEQERKSLAQSLRTHPLFGGLLGAEADTTKRLVLWEDGLDDGLFGAGDAISHWPSKALPLILRELDQSLGLGGFDPVGAAPGQDAQRVGWLKALTKQGCEVYRWEREAGVPGHGDWVPRVPAAQGDAWPPAPMVQLPIFFVTNSGYEERGLNGWLRLCLWPCAGAQLEYLPSLPQRVQPLAKSWETGLGQARDWMRQQLKGQGGAWQDHALVWDVQTPETAYDLLMGNSASTAFALAGLWLARQWAPAPWRQPLMSLTQAHWRHRHITAAIRATAGGAELLDDNDLGPVGGVDAKRLASWVLHQGSTLRPPPLHVALAQPVSDDPAEQMPTWVHRHANALHLLTTLAREALDLNDAQAELQAAFLPHLASFAPQGGNSPWHLPQHDAPRLVPHAADTLAHQRWQDTLQDAAFPSREPTELEPFALRRWALRANERHEGGSVDRLYVRLSVQEEAHRPRHSPPTQGTASAKSQGSPLVGDADGFSLEQLLADYEQDARHPTRRLQALQLVGAPGGGKTWMLARFEQACCERLLWQQEWQASHPFGADEAGKANSPYPYLVVPLYVALSELPADTDKPVDIMAWFRAEALGKGAPDSRLRRRLVQPGSEPGIRLRILLDGLNELKVPAGGNRQDRARQVVRAIWEGAQPGLMMLLGTRTHHRFDLDHTDARGQKFEVATAALQPWSVSAMVGYLRQRWAEPPHQPLLDKVPDIEARLRAQPRLQEVLGLPLYLRIQCELLEAGATELLDSRASLLAALLWRRLHHEFTLKPTADGPIDPGLVTEQERLIAADLLRYPDQAPPAFPRQGRLLQGLFALAWQMWLAHPDEPVASRGQVALPLDSGPVPTGVAGNPGALSVRGCLRALGWPEPHCEAWIEQWIKAAQELGWLHVNPRSQIARFAHQAYGEFLASQQLFWKPRHAAKHETPKPTDWTADELARLLAPPALPRGCIQELEKQARDADAQWEAAGLGPLIEAWRTDGVSADWHEVEEETSAQFLREQEGSGRRYLRHLKVLEEAAGRATWRIARMGDLYAHHGFLLRLDPGKPWHQQVSAWRYLWTTGEIWSVFRAKAQAQVAQHLGAEGGAEQAERMWKATGQLPEAPPGALDEIALLALEALPDPLPWLQALLGAAKAVTFADEGAGPVRQTGCWALLSRGLLQEDARLDALHPDSAVVARWRRETANLLLAVNQSADPEWQTGAGQDLGLGSVPPAHDLRHRIQAGLSLGRQGALGTDAGDHMRYERVVAKADDGREVHSVRLKPAHWCVVHPSQAAIKPFLVARYAVTVGEFRAFVEAGGYADENAAWWLQGQPAERSAARAWLLHEHGQTVPAGRRPYCWGDRRMDSECQPMVAVTWYEANAYAHWATRALGSGWLAAQASAVGVEGLVLRLPTEPEWLAALTGVPEDGWPGFPVSGDPTPLAFNHLATGLARPTPVGSFPGSRSPIGLMDTAGNQWEWCANSYENQGYAQCPATLERDSELRALCGGGFSSTAALCRVGSRVGDAPDDFSFGNGFRLVLAVVL